MSTTNRVIAGGVLASAGLIAGTMMLGEAAPPTHEEITEAVESADNELVRARGFTKGSLTQIQKAEAELDRLKEMLAAYAPPEPVDGVQLEEGSGYITVTGVDAVITHPPTRWVPCGVVLSSGTMYPGTEDNPASFIASFSRKSSSVTFSKTEGMRVRAYSKAPDPADPHREVFEYVAGPVGPAWTDVSHD